MGRAVSRSPKDLPGTIHHDDTGVRQRLGGHSLGMPREQINPDAHRTTLPQLTLQRGRPAGTFVGVLPVTSWAFCRNMCGRSADSRRSLLHQMQRTAAGRAKPRPIESS